MLRTPAGLSPVTFIPGLLYEALIRARNGLYSAELLRPKHLSAPVISIGNMTMGGTGKTPLVIHVAQTLVRLGFQPAILSRGYGRTEPGQDRRIEPEDRISSPAKTLGDEPALIRRHVPSASLGISSNRFHMGNRMERTGNRLVFILDDGFQHRQLSRDLDIVILDSSQSLVSDRVIPRGTLREPLSGLKRCHIVVINQSRSEPGNAEVRREAKRHNPNAEFFGCTQTIKTLTPFHVWAEGKESRPAQAQSAFLIAAVGNPERFKRDIRALGIEVKGAKFFRDHYWLKPGDWNSCIEAARSNGADSIILTEKDAIKISSPPEFPLLVAVQSTEISDEEGFERILKRCAGE